MQGRGFLIKSGQVYRLPGKKSVYAGKRGVSYKIGTKYFTRLVEVCMCRENVVDSEGEL